MKITDPKNKSIFFFNNDNKFYKNPSYKETL